MSNPGWASIVNQSNGHFMYWGGTSLPKFLALLEQGHVQVNTQPPEPANRYKYVNGQWVTI